MTSPFYSLLLLFVGLSLVQFLAALPWLSVLDPYLVKTRLRQPKTLGLTIGLVLGIGLVLTLVFQPYSDQPFLAFWGRLFASVLQLQLSVDLVLLVLFVMLKLWPKGGAVALSSFREGVRQPMFWVLVIACMFLFAVSWVLPYFTFGEDIKMLKDLGFITIMFAGALFSVLTASMSISEEIEGRTAVTVMSKPISRRQFLLGKFAGIFSAAVLLSLIVAWGMMWTVYWKDLFEPEIGETPQDPRWIAATLQSLSLEQGTAFGLLRGMLFWTDDLGMTLAGIVVSNCQVMVLLAIAVALATRVPMIVNALLCLSVYFLGHLTTVLTAVAQDQYALVAFIAEVFNTILPSLDLFDMGPAVVRESPLPPLEFTVYILSVTLYAVIYTALVLLFGLVLFEDRDLA